MAISSGGGGGGFTPMSDINTTPLVDVMLVLLIVFLIAIPVSIQSVKMDIPVIKLLNKVDQIADLSAFQKAIPDLIPISAKNRDGLNDLETALLDVIGLDQVSTNGTLVTNLRHYQQLLQTQETLEGVLAALKTGLTGDLIAQDLRYALHHLGEITGHISNDDLLKNIALGFCVCLALCCLLECVVQFGHFVCNQSCLGISNHRSNSLSLTCDFGLLTERL